MGTMEDSKHDGHGHSARPGQAGKPSEIRHDGQGGRLLSRGCGFPSLGGSRFPSLPALFGLLRRLRFAAPSLRGVAFSLARRLWFGGGGGCGLPLPRPLRFSLARGSSAAALAVGVFFLRPGPAALARLAWPGRLRPPGGGRPAGSPCPRSPLILLETSQTFYKFKALAAAATPRPSSVWFGRGRRRSACVRRPPRLFVPAQVAAGVLRFLVSGARKKPEKSLLWKKCGKIPKNTKNEYHSTDFMPKKEECLNYFQKRLDKVMKMCYNIGKKT